jgi:hypothetical protein
MKQTFIALTTGISLMAVTAHAHSEKAHVHGNANMQVVVEGNMVEIGLQSPLNSLVGFEHAPRNERQRKAIQAMEEKFRTPASLFVPTPAAQCTVQPVELEMPFKEGAASKSQHKDEHAELEATIRFQCDNPSALKGMEVKLFEAFPKLHRIDVQTISGSGQAAARLTPKKRNLQW